MKERSKLLDFVRSLENKEVQGNEQVMLFAGMGVVNCSLAAGNNCRCNGDNCDCDGPVLKPITGAPIGTGILIF